MAKKLRDIKALISDNKKNNKKRCLSFPFLIIEPSNRNETKIDLQMQKDSKKLCMVSNYNMRIHGDLEIVSLIQDAKNNKIAE